MLESSQTPTSPAFCSVDELSRITGLSRRTIYARLGAGDLLAKKIGRRTVLDVEAALAWIRAQPAAVIAPDRRTSHRRAA